jgi:hypothetical protein
MPLLREALDLQLPLRSQLKLNIYTSSSLLMTFLVAGVFLTKFNKIRDVNKNFSLLGKNTQLLNNCISKTAGRIKFAEASNYSEFNLV